MASSHSPEIQLLISSSRPDLSKLHFIHRLASIDLELVSGLEACPQFVHFTPASTNRECSQEQRWNDVEQSRLS